MSLHAMPVPPDGRGMNPEMYAIQFARVNGISLDDAKNQLRAKYGDPKPPENFMVEGQRRFYQPPVDASPLSPYVVSTATPETATVSYTKKEIKNIQKEVGKLRKEYLKNNKYDSSRYRNRSEWFAEGTAYAVREWCNLHPGESCPVNQFKHL